MSEARMWKYLKDKNDATAQIFMQRITEKLAKGVADVWWFEAARNEISTGWFEMKYVKAADSNLKLDIRPDQVLWLMELAKRGCLSGVLIRGGNAVWIWIPAISSVEWADAIQSRAWFAIDRKQVWQQHNFTIRGLVSAMRWT